MNEQEQAELEQTQLALKDMIRLGMNLQEENEKLQAQIDTAQVRITWGNSYTGEVDTTYASGVQITYCALRDENDREIAYYSFSQGCWLRADGDTISEWMDINLDPAIQPKV